LSLSAYHYEIEDLISQVTTPDDEIYYDNLNKANAQGIEIEWEGKYDCGLLTRASYVVQRTEDGDTHQELSGSPRHALSVDICVY
jgi:outer membrane cobalamin receptor